MCLDSIVPNAVLPKNEVYGWKIFNTYGTKNLYFPYYRPSTMSTYTTSGVVPRNRWLTSDQHIIGPTNSDSNYLTGFHVFRRRKDARAYQSGGRVLKIRIKQIRLLGLQDGYDCYIADKLLVPRETPKKGKTSNGKRKETKRK